MARFDRGCNPWKKQQELDRTYTYLYHAKKSLEDKGDYLAAAKINEIMQDYLAKGAVARYEYAPMN